MRIKNNRNWMISENKVTPESDYLNRRTFMRMAGSVATGTALTGTALAMSSAVTSGFLGGAAEARTLDLKNVKPDTSPDGILMKKQRTSFEAITGYNNFYEFGMGKDDPAIYASKMTTDPWSVTVSGLTEKTGRFALEDLIDFNKLEERIYRLRCVEAWSMVVPWIGVPLVDVIKKLEPKSDAKYVAFETLERRSEMRGLSWPVLDWPYREGLRLDEAMNPLTLLAVGLYGQVMPNQNGAPIRLVVPWKYGFKSIKSIVGMRFTSRQPKTSWQMSAPQEYGFYSNVNPMVDHPRWSQASERRIGEFGRRKTQMFNGYGEQVAGLYKDMDLSKYY